jgi:hypothetical protein
MNSTFYQWQAELSPAGFEIDVAFALASEFDEEAREETHLYDPLPDWEED